MHSLAVDRHVTFLFVSGMILLTGCDWEMKPTSISDQHSTKSDRRNTEPTHAAKTLIVAMGNSLTEGLNVDPQQAYPTQLERRLQAGGHQVRVINAGIAGETSSGALSRAAWILTLKPDIVILETGANDGLRGIDPELTSKNIDALVSLLKDNRVTVVLAGMQIVQNMGQPYTDKSRRVYSTVAENHRLIFIPFFLEGVAANPQLNQSDGIHPNAQGYAAVVDHALPYVVQALANRFEQ